MELKMGDFIRTYKKSYEEVESFWKAIQEAGCERGEGMEELEYFDDYGDILVWDDDNTTYFIDQDCRTGHRYRDVTDEFFSEENTTNSDHEDMRVVVYYTDGSSYTNKQVEEVDVDQSKMFIKIAPQGSLLSTEKLEAGVQLHKSIQELSKTVEIDLEHVAGYCVMRKKSKNDMWAKSFFPLKPTFSVEASVSGLKENKDKPYMFTGLNSVLGFPKHELQVIGSGGEGKSLIDEALLLEGVAFQTLMDLISNPSNSTGAGSGFSPNLTLDNYVPKEEDIVINDKLTMVEYKKWWKVCLDNGFTPMFNEIPSTKKKFEVTCLRGGKIMSSEMRYHTTHRDVTHLFTGDSGEVGTDEGVKATAGYTLADGSDSGEYYIGDKFIVIDSSTFSLQSVVSLYGDDRSSCPLFKLEEGHTDHDCCNGDLGAYEAWENLIPLTK
ncbi:MAG: hypothetical protein GOVbin4162_105 [Prokaryotic dsDNA virus sp.]|nr:MAG: hypothetical protein GOVbin4162_105 [Prokaryotic dsDNA virus sp.]|tara:strand:- start:265 stop:1575 length:1311 start_codon:yes stop_codon:yes gene_type:complete